MRTRTLHRVGANLSWLVGERIFRMALGLFVLGYVARYMHTAGFGAFSYALSMTSLFAAVANLGIDGIVIRELVKEPERRDEILGTAWTMKLAGGLSAIGLVALSALALGSSDAPPSYMIILSLQFLPLSFDVIDLWFQRNIQSKFTVMAKSASFVVGALIRVALVWFRAPVWAFCVSIAIDALLLATGLVIVFLKNQLTPLAWRFRGDIAKTLWMSGWPLILANALVAIYQRVEQFLVMDWLGSSAMGIYAAAARISDAWNIIPALILPTVYPLLVQKKLEDESEYKRRVQMVFDLLTGIGLAIAISITFAAKFVIPIVWGREFMGAVGVLMIQAWSAVFSFSGAMRNQYFIMENLTRYSWLCAILGIASNLVCGAFFMSRIGPPGAAAGALIGYMVSAFASSWLFGRLHPCARYQTQALFILFRIRSALAEARRFL